MVYIHDTFAGNKTNHTGIGPLNNQAAFVVMNVVSLFSKSCFNLVARLGSRTRCKKISWDTIFTVLVYTLN